MVVCVSQGPPVGLPARAHSELSSSRRALGCSYIESALQVAHLVLLRDNGLRKPRQAVEPPNHSRVMTDYFAILSKAINDTESISAQRRAETYEIARAALKRELRQAGLNVTSHKAEHERAALERAILRVELSISQSDEGRSALERLRKKQRKRVTDHGEVLATNIAPAEHSSREVVILPPRHDIARIDPFHLERDRRPELPPYEGKNITIFTLPSETRKPPSLGERAAARFSETLRTALVAMAAVALYVVVSERDRGSEEPAAGETRAASKLAASVPPGALHVPLPKGTPRPAVYGVYAIHEGQLVELNPVAIAPVDPRLKTVFQVTQPSVTRLATGKLTFVVYRRDLIVGAPEKVSVRVVATLTRAMKFDGAGTVVTIPQRETWIIRSNGYDFRVLPVPEDREMIIVRPEDPEFAIPPGRYALMLNGQPYDFTVEGAVTDPAQCVESAPTARGPIFYDCPPKQRGVMSKE